MHLPGHMGLHSPGARPRGKALQAKGCKDPGHQKCGSSQVLLVSAPRFCQWVRSLWTRGMPCVMTKATDKAGAKATQEGGVAYKACTEVPFGSTPCQAFSKASCVFLLQVRPGASEL